MITLAQAKTIAEIAGVALPVLIEAFKAAKCAIDGCDVELRPTDAPDLHRRASENLIALDRIATRTDRASIDAAFGASAFSGIDDGDAEREFVQRHNDLHGIDADAEREVYGE